MERTTLKDSKTTLAGLDLVAVIMAGGIGSRFWPLSTAGKPKQFLKLFGDRSLLQLSYDRIASLVPPDRILVLTNSSLVSQVSEQLPQVPGENIIEEPMRRDTAAAVSLAAFLCQRRFGNPVMTVLPSDHLIEPVEEFQRALISAARAASASAALYTFGISPTHPSTGYGYLERGARIATGDGISHFELLRFREKPELETAKSFIKQGSFFWNSGIFVWTVEAILEEISRHLPSHRTYLEPLTEFDRTPAWPSRVCQAFEPLPSISIDYGVMEKASTVRMVAGPFSWSDLGGWLALEDYLEKDESGNARRGQILTLDAESNLVFSEDAAETIALVGVKDLIVIRSGQQTLIAHRNRAEDIKKLF